MADHDPVRPRVLFRTAAVERYVAAHEQTILPRWVRPHLFGWAWLLISFLMLGGLLSWWVQIPVYAQGTAVVVDWAAGSTKHAALVIFVAPDQANALAIEQTVFFEYDRQRRSRPLVNVLPQLLGPTEAQQTFQLGPAASFLQQPMAVAIAPFDTVAEPLAIEQHLGSVYPVQIVTGTRRVLSLLPGLGSLGT